MSACSGLVKDSGGVPLSRWTTTRQDGCGQTIFRLVIGGGLAMWTYVFDATTHELLGLSAYGDTPLDTCGHTTSFAGVTPNCAEGRVCLTCGSADDCVDACSVAEREREGGSRWSWEDVTLVGCDGLAAADRPRLTAGCGRITQIRGGASVVFDATSHEAIAVRIDAPDPAGRCAGVWGEAEATCAEETSCSLCDDDPSPCVL